MFPKFDLDTVNRVLPIMTSIDELRRVIDLESND
jgi:hypothetical protein